MSSLKKLFLVGATLLIASCQNNSDINDMEEDFSTTQQVSEEQSAQIVQSSNFDALPSAGSISEAEFIPDRIGFSFDSYQISPKQKEILDAQIAFYEARKNDVKKIQIKGYCDERGSIEYNYALGSKRANAVKKYFVSKGVSKNMIQTISYGKERVLVEGSNEEAYKQNRVGMTTLCTGNC